MNMILAATGLAATLTAAAGLDWPSSRLDVHTEIEIAASPAQVWSVLADIARYREWNPYHVRVDGDLVEGTHLNVEIRKPDGSVVKIRPHVIAVVPERRLDWGGGIAGVFKGVHVFELHATGNGCTRLVQRETFAGLFVGFARLDDIEEGYGRMNRALKARVEAGNQPSVCRTSSMLDSR
jgi:hypothetical protein